MHGGDLKRDYWKEVAALLNLFASSTNISMTEIKKRLYAQRSRGGMIATQPNAFWEEVLAMLVENGMVQQRTGKSECVVFPSFQITLCNLRVVRRLCVRVGGCGCGFTGSHSAH